MNYLKKSNLILSLFFILYFFTAFSFDVDYKVFINAPEKELKIEMSFIGDKSGYTYLNLPELTDDQSFEIYASGKKIDNFLMKNMVIIFKHPPKAKTVVKYSIKCSETFDQEHFFSPEESFDELFFRFKGHKLFPIFLNDIHSEGIMTINWLNLPENWKILNSFGSAQHQSTSISPYNLQMSLFTAGEFYIIPSWEAENAPLVGFLNFDDEAINKILPLIETTVKAQREFWNDEDFNNYAIILIPIRQPAIKGSAFLNAFTMSFDVDQIDNLLEQIKFVFCHEYFHSWNPYKLIPSGFNDYKELWWFNEGFTDYFAAKICNTSQLMTIEASIEEINKHLFNYYRSPYRNSDEQSYFDRDDNDFEMALLAYQRGCLLALLWEYKIQQHSSLCLDDIMKELLNEVKATGKSINKKMLLDIASTYIEDAEKDVLDYIVEGKDFNLPPTLPAVGWNSDYVLTWEQDVGFSSKTAYERNVIWGVVEGSTAYNAGLRDGQIFKNFTMGKNGQVSIMIQKGHTFLPISYMCDPNEKYPQYQKTELN